MNPTQDDLPRRNRWRAPRLPLTAAAVAALVGVAAFGLAMASGGPAAAAGTAQSGAAVPLVSSAMSAPGAGWAAPGWGMRGGAPMAGGITITAISGTQLSLRTADGWTRTIDASGASVTRAGQSVALGSLQVGDQITFRETKQADGTFTVDSIAVVSPHVAGSVSAVIPGASLTLRTADGTSKTVELTGTTTYRLAGQSATSSALTVGEQVAIEGSVAADGTFTASAVDILPARVAGTVSAKSSSTITITVRSGKSVTIDVAASTTYQVPGTSSATLADIAVGATIEAQGTSNADGSLNAGSVRVLPVGQPGRGPRMGGQGMPGAWGWGPAGAAPTGPASGSGA